jgi:hypothetical protein
MAVLTASLAIRPFLARIALVPATDEWVNMIDGTAIANSPNEVRAVSIQSPFSV